MSGSGPDHDGEPPGRPKIAEVHEYRRILDTLDHQQHLNLSAHLYSAYLIKRDKPFDGPEDSDRKVQESRVPHKYWTAWPTANASPPPLIDDSCPDDVPGPVRLAQIKQATRRARTARHPQFRPETEPAVVLLDACEAFLQRTVYSRIHAEQRAQTPLEPVVDPEPRIADLWPASLLALVDKYLALPELTGPALAQAQKRPGSIDYSQLDIHGPAAQRIRALFGTSGSQDPEQVTQTGGQDDSDGTDAEADSDPTKVESEADLPGAVDSE